MLARSQKTNFLWQCPICILHLVWKIATLWCKQASNFSLSSLTLLSASLSDLCGETGLDRSDTSSRAAGVAGNEIQSVLSLIELRIWGSAGFAGDIFH